MYLGVIAATIMLLACMNASLISTSTVYCRFFFFFKKAGTIRSRILKKKKDTADFDE